MNTNHKVMTELPPVPDGAAFSVVGVNTFNHKPHPFCITEKHVAYASDHCSGRIGEEACRKFPCGVGRRGSPIPNQDPCQLSYDEHTHETALFIAIHGDQLGLKKLGNLGEVPGLHEWVYSIKDIVTKHNIDGFAFPMRKKDEVPA